MKKIGMMLALSATVCSGVFAAEEVLKLFDARDFPPPVALVEADGEKVFEVIPLAMKSTITFEVDREKTYLLKGSFRNLSQKDISVLFGFVPLDSDGEEILSEYVNCANGTDTELAEAVKFGDTTIKLKDGAGWEKAVPLWVVAFNTKNDLSDLPNRDVSSPVKSVSDNKVTLSTPTPKAYPAGTKVRAQFSGATYLYTAGNRKTSDQWQTFSGKINGEGWRAGTMKARVLIYPRPSGDNRQAKIQFKDISVEIVD